MTSTALLKKKPIVLLVDDEPFIQMALGRTLEKLGCLVEKASNGSIALSMVKEKYKENNNYDIIFMDANMPVMSGYEAAEHIRQIKEIDTPIICISAQESKNHIDLCNKVGMAEVISKPCNIKILESLLKKYNLIQ